MVRGGGGGIYLVNNGLGKTETKLELFVPADTKNTG